MAPRSIIAWVELADAWAGVTSSLIFHSRFSTSFLLDQPSTAAAGQHALHVAVEDRIVLAQRQRQHRGAGRAANARQIGDFAKVVGTRRRAVRHGLRRLVQGYGRGRNKAETGPQMLHFVQGFSASARHVRKRAIKR